ncbi:uncharacterized protein LOC129889574 isoform X2 [Solanum dulcamara]|uniref:uncharacterized protein LOC129889574 isoform X2 n=1 Tax=Solanum dulcamara TaxID=45834 RepID=UPI0024855F6E|nr:uncharacterized protein LOC129889574 isoform X2 [Solanum dulcamara]
MKFLYHIFSFKCLLLLGLLMTLTASHSFTNPNRLSENHLYTWKRTSDTTGRTEEFISSPGLEMSQALRRLEEQLSLNDDSIKKLFPSMLMQLMATIHLSRCRGIQTVSCCNIIQMRNLKIVHKHVKAQIWDTA